jgi:dipeptidyl aminopeptidase/acylaminoacyl peptidase
MPSSIRHRLLLVAASSVLLAGGALRASALTPTELFDLRTCKVEALSPDGRLLIYAIGEYARDRGSNRETVHLRDLQTGARQVLFTPDDRAGRFAFSPDGSSVVFTRGSEYGDEVWLMRADGTERRRVAGPGRFGALVWSPDGRMLAHLVPVRDDAYEGVPGRITVADDLGWRHLTQGEREGRLRQLHLLDLATGEDHVRATPDLDVRALAWSPDGTQLALSAKHRRDLGRVLRTELYIVARDADTPPRRLTDNPGPDDQPLWLPGDLIASQSHADSLAESTPARIVVRDAVSGREVARHLEDFDNCVWGVFHHGGRFYFRGAWRGSVALFRAENRHGKQLSEPGWNCREVHFGGQRAVFAATSWTNPGAIFSLDLRNGRRTLLVDPNERWLQRVNLTEPQPLTVTVAGREIESWLFLPEGHVSGQGLPTVLSIHGGPQWMYGGSFLPEFHVLPAFGYAVLAPNPTGSTGYGLAHMNDIRGDWIDRPARELLAVVDHAVAMGWSDPDLLAVMGGSYGGYLAAALTAQTDRFRAAACDRMYPHLEAFWGATDEKWFPEWEFGGRPFDDAAREIYRRNDIFGLVDRVRTPTLVSHGLLDYRCPEDGSLMWHSALLSQGVPARLLRFQTEGHGIRDRANQVFYLEQVLAWFERWVLVADSP